MSDALSLKAEPRARAGKGASRALRRTGRVPAVIYGAGQPATGIHLEEKLLVRQLQTGHFMTTRFNIEVDGAREQALPRDVQFHPVSDRPIHVDFLRINADTRVTVMVPVRFVEEELSPGIKKGATLNIVRHEVELECAANAIPDDIIISLAGLEVGSSIHISSVTLPGGAKPVIDRDFTIATVAAPSAMRSAEADADEAAEPAAA